MLTSTRLSLAQEYSACVGGGEEVGCWGVEGLGLSLKPGSFERVGTQTRDKMAGLK